MGPGLTWTMRPSTSKSCSLRRRVSALSCSSSRERCELGGRRDLEEADGRKLERLGAALAEVEGLLPGQPPLHEPAARARGLDDHRRRRRRPGTTARAAPGAAPSGSSMAGGHRGRGRPRRAAQRASRASRARPSAAYETCVTRSTPAGARPAAPARLPRVPSAPRSAVGEAPAHETTVVHASSALASERGARWP